MSTNSSKITALVLATLLTGVTTTANANPGDLSAGLRIGQAQVSAFDDDPSLSSKEDTAFGVTLGYEFAANWTAELEYVNGGSQVTGNLNSLDIDISTLAGYAAFRSSGEWYFLARLGVVQYELKSSQRPDFSATGASYSFGAGYKVQQNLRLELDFTIVESDTNWLLVAARYSF